MYVQTKMYERIGRGRHHGQGRTSATRFAAADEAVEVVRGRAEVVPLWLSFVKHAVAESGLILYPQ